MFEKVITYLCLTNLEYIFQHSLRMKDCIYLVSYAIMILLVLNVENDFWVDALLTGTVKYKSNNNAIFEKVDKILV